MVLGRQGQSQGRQKYLSENFRVQIFFFLTTLNFDPILMIFTNVVKLTKLKRKKKKFQNFLQYFASYRFYKIRFCLPPPFHPIDFFDKNKNSKNSSGRLLHTCGNFMSFGAIPWMQKMLENVVNLTKLKKNCLVTLNFFFQKFSQN